MESKYIVREKISSERENNPNSPTKAAPWWEIIIVIVVYLACAVPFPNLRVFLTVPLLFYIIIESRRRHRSWVDNGFNIRDVPAGFRKTFGWLLLVVFGTQILYFMVEKYFLPDVFAHILARIPFGISQISIGILIILAISTFLEEQIFRALFQNRLCEYINPAVAIGLVSLVFASAHFSPGPTMVVFMDMFGVFVDSLIYGFIFQRSRNVFIAWIAHFLADVVGLTLLIFIK